MQMVCTLKNSAIQSANHIRVQKSMAMNTIVVDKWAGPNYTLEEDIDKDEDMELC